VLFAVGTGSHPRYPPQRAPQPRTPPPFEPLAKSPLNKQRSPALTSIPLPTTAKTSARCLSLPEEKSWSSPTRESWLPPRMRKTRRPFMEPDFLRDFRRLSNDYPEAIRPRPMTRRQPHLHPQHHRQQKEAPCAARYRASRREFPLVSPQWSARALDPPH